MQFYASQSCLLETSFTMDLLSYTFSLVLWGLMGCFSVAVCSFFSWHFSRLHDNRRATPGKREGVNERAPWVSSFNPHLLCFSAHGKKHRLLSLIFKALRTCFLPRDFRCIFILHGFPVVSYISVLKFLKFILELRFEQICTDTLQAPLFLQGSVKQNSCVHGRLSRDRLRLVLKMTYLFPQPPCVPRGQSEQQRSVWWELDKERGQRELKGRTTLKSGL